MFEMFKFLPAVVKKVAAFFIAYSTALISGYVWFEAKIKAAEDNAIVIMKEYRQTDMNTLQRELDDIKSDVRDVKRILMEKR
jgi:nitrogen fixation/metabolism regulation signal transduction histidine kinase